MRKLLLISIFILGLINTNIAQPIYANPMQYTAQELVEDILISGCLQAFNVTYTGNNLSKGYFEDPGGNFDFASGVILTSGFVVPNCLGPNSGSGTSSTSNGPSYPLLSSLIPQNSFDCAILEFDFIPSDDTLWFRYIFGSEEYNEYVNTSFNDVFAFFLSGPNPAGGTYTNYNVALIPGTTTPVSINNVNNGSNTPSTGPCVNCGYFVDNTQTTNSPIEMDGYTTPLIAKANVIPCQTYHIILAIGDAGDSALDSNVFLEAGSFTSGGQLEMQSFGAVGNGYTMYEGCENYYVFYRTDTTDLSQPMPVNLTITGTATANADYTLNPPGALVIPAGQTSVTLFYSAILDNITEGTEMMIFTLASTCPCGGATLNEIKDTVYIFDNPELVAFIDQPDTLICSTQPQQLTLTAKANTNPAITHYLWDNGSTDTVRVVNPPTGAISTYSVTVTDECGQFEVDEVVITISDMSSVTVSTKDVLCFGSCTGEVEVVPDNGFSPFSYSWNPFGSGSSNSGLAHNLCAGYYNVTVSDQFGCTAEATFAINSPTEMIMQENISVIKCYGDENGYANILVSGGTSPYDYIWSNGATTPGITNVGAGTYSFTATDANSCVVDTTIVFTTPDPLILYSSESQTICLSQPANLVTQTIGGTVPYTYQWSNGFTDGNITVFPPESETYCVTVVDSNGCVSNSRCITVNVNPPLRFSYNDLYNDTICKGDTTTILSMLEGGNGGPYFYEILNGPAYDPPFEVTPEVSQQYIIVGRDGCGTPAIKDTLDIVVLEAPLVIFQSDIVRGCQPLEVQFNNSTDETNVAKYLWDFNDSEFFNYSVIRNPKHVFQNAGTYDVTLEVFTEAGCSKKLTAEDMIEVLAIPEARFIANPQVVSITQPIIRFENLSQDANRVFWSFGDGDSVLVENVYHRYNEVGEFVVSLIAEKDYETAIYCRDTAFLVVEVEPHSTLYTPNAFNPYSPISENKTFRPIGLEINVDDYYFTVYNRWGELVFETEDPLQSWDGSNNGSGICPLGSYTWVVKYIDLSGIRKSKTGVVTLIK